MASLLFGISFRNPDTGEEAQLGLETGTNQLYVRSTRGGDWSAWSVPQSGMEVTLLMLLYELPGDAPRYFFHRGFVHCVIALSKRP